MQQKRNNDLYLKQDDEKPGKLKVIKAKSRLCPEYIKQIIAEELLSVIHYKKCIFSDFGTYHFKGWCWVDNSVQWQSIKLNFPPAKHLFTCVWYVSERMAYWMDRIFKCKHTCQVI